MHKVLVAAIVAVGCGALASPAQAELVFFESGRALSVKSVALDEAGSLVLQLRGGGEIVCDPDLIARISEDEVPYPEPRPDPPQVVGMTRDAVNALIAEAAAAEGVDVRLVRAVVQVESAFQPMATSRKGAMGLMQLMPETARQFAVADPYDAKSNVEAGVRYLKALLKRYPLRLALAAYNAGSGAVDRFGGIPPYGETQLYVARILRLLGTNRL